MHIIDVHILSIKMEIIHGVNKESRRVSGDPSVGSNLVERGTLPIKSG